MLSSTTRNDKDVSDESKEIEKEKGDKKDEEVKKEDEDKKKDDEDKKKDEEETGEEDNKDANNYAIKSGHDLTLSLIIIAITFIVNVHDFSHFDIF